MVKADKIVFKRGSDTEKIKILEKEREEVLKILGSSPDILIIRHAQGQLYLLDEIISALKETP